MSFISSRVLTNCQKWLTTCHIWLTTCLQTVKKWWLIFIQSILPIDYWKNQYNQTIIGPSTTSNKFYLQRKHTNKETNRQQRCFFIYNKKNIFIYQKRLIFIFTNKFYIHTVQANRTKIQGRPPLPPVDNILTHNTYAQTHKHASAFSTSAFFERGKPISEGGKLSTNQKAAFSYVLLLS
jgi:hypothetical protein